MKIKQSSLEQLDQTTLENARKDLTNIQQEFEDAETEYYEMDGDDEFLLAKVSKI